jgi:hypothetical protein
MWAAALDDVLDWLFPSLIGSRNLPLTDDKTPAPCFRENLFRVLRREPARPIQNSVGPIVLRLLVSRAQFLVDGGSRSSLLDETEDCIRGCLAATEKILLLLSSIAERTNVAEQCFTAANRLGESTAAYTRLEEIGNTVGAVYI